jgi:hypothetical protein
MRSPEEIYSAPAAADYSATIARFVTVNSSGLAVLAGTSAHALGVMYNAPIAAELARIDAGGTHRIEAGSGGLALGDKVYSDSTGKGVAGIATAGAWFAGVVTLAAAAGAVAQFFWGPSTNAG